jgi:hypothetical protein
MWVVTLVRRETKADSSAKLTFNVLEKEAERVKAAVTGPTDWIVFEDADLVEHFYAKDTIRLVRIREMR